MTSLIPLLLLAWLPWLPATAQPIPLEGMAGHRYYWYQQVVARGFSEQSRLGFFHTSSLHVYYDEAQTDEVMTQSYLTYRVGAGITAALGTFYATGPGFTPAFAVHFLKRRPHLTLLAVPRVDLWRKATYEIMALLEYTPPLGERLNLYTRLQVMSNHGPRGHNRSYQNVRAGLQLKTFGIGLALNVDEYGRETGPATNLGLFLRKEL
jgi:hypothetical protein